MNFKGGFSSMANSKQKFGTSLFGFKVDVNAYLERVIRVDKRLKRAEAENSDSNLKITN